MSTKQMVTMDGNTAAAHVAYTFTEIAAIYPITPSSPMAEKTDVWAARGRKNMFGQRVRLVEMQSEAGAIAAVHGALQTGALATSFTSSQGLLLMIPVMHRIAGERLPCVLHVATRTVGTHAMSIFGDHSDVMNCRQTGFAMLSTASVQEVMDLSAVAHLCAIRCRVPFLHFFDGFRTSHELCKVEEPDLSELAALVDRDALAAFRAQALNPEHPRMRGTVQNGDVFFQIREASRRFYDALPDEVEACMGRISALTGRDYHLFQYYGEPEAEDVIVAMGSVSGTAQETVDALCAGGRKVGFLQVRLFRPFSVRHFLAALPESVRRIAVLDRCAEMGSTGEPLHEDICTALMGSGRSVLVVGGRYGLSSKDVDPSQIRDVFDNLRRPEPLNRFSIGITDDVTHLSLPCGEPLNTEGENILMSCKFWGLGSDGTVGANKNTVEIINSVTPLYAQAYFEYDAKKSYGLTLSHLRIGKGPVRASCAVQSADIVACHCQNYVRQYDMADELKDGGTFLLNCTWKADELDRRLPASLKRALARKHARLFLINATDIAHELGLGNHVNVILQAAFFRLARVIPEEQAEKYMKDAVRRTYVSKGEDVVARNEAAIRAGFAHVFEAPVPESWQNAEDEAPAPRIDAPSAVTRLLDPINAQKGNALPVSAFLGYEDGQMDMGLTAWEKRDIAVRVPSWTASLCVQCNRCSLVCPHAVIRPFLLTKKELAAAPEGLMTASARGRGAEGLSYTLQISVADCTGCGSCVEACPASGRALVMVPRAEARDSREVWNYALGLEEKHVFDPFTVKGSQFRRPLLEFSAACAGCGETPYAKLLTQLFGTRAYWANATGCSQAWGGAVPGIPYAVNARGQGPAWTNSLFENNAELCLGMLLSVRQQREAQRMRVAALARHLPEGATKDAAGRWLELFDDYDGSEEASNVLKAELEKLPQTGEVKDILAHADHLVKKCFWMFGGDGWAYDIGFGGLDHVLASGEDVNVLVVDTEVYSNTGGQSSKATPLGAVAQFAASGKRSGKKDLGAMFMAYGNIYVAQVSMGASAEQLMKALKEASAYRGPSLVIAYAPCTAHGIRAGMAHAQEEMKRATQSGYWPLYRYHPDKDQPFSLDSGEPTLDYGEFLQGENRYASLQRTCPDQAFNLEQKARNEAERRYRRYAFLASRNDRNEN
ncbi:pyruvate:ferredoxin (flavodoxin) oxidoreductase [uncultured Mailhella sp.]|uniref:pyruvate:ferredoxin (flavodoxin) oxidoreductase n=1 Tax=uncultured Mailhella sp. TaxID=1981031 RepID=UPI0025E406B6|nr:pyruvate:ferredoxin (flavodoxin) oxidoreductase [uncultured Mailhella sp.]